jgi:hypothetical protein
MYNMVATPNYWTPNIGSLVWFNKTNTVQGQENKAHKRAYIIGHKYYIPNVNLVNVPLGKYYNVVHKTSPHRVYPASGRKGYLKTYYKSRGYNPYHIYLMANNIISAREANNKEKTRQRQREINSIPDAKAKRILRERMRQAQLEHQPKIQLWTNIRNIAKNLIGKHNNKNIRSNIRMNIRNQHPRPTQSEIKFLRNLIPNYRYKNNPYIFPSSNRNYFIQRQNGTTVRNRVGPINNTQKMLVPGLKNSIKQRWLSNNAHRSIRIPNGPRSAEPVRARTANRRGPRTAPRG